MVSLFPRPAGPANDRHVVRAAFAVAAIAGSLGFIGPAAAGDTALTLSEPWIRFIIASRPAAGYFSLTNESAEEKVLTGASSPDCGMVMIHKSMTENGANAMKMMENVVVPPHGEVTFAPGGYHLMCMKPKPEMKDAQTVPMTLTFKDGSTINGDFKVRGAAEH